MLPSAPDYAYELIGLINRDICAKDRTTTVLLNYRCISSKMIMSHGKMFKTPSIKVYSSDLPSVYLKEKNMCKLILLVIIQY